jgi:hypothetical protein
MATQNPYSDSLLMDAFRGSLSNAESLGRGFAVAPVGLFGDMEGLLRKGVNYSFGRGGVNVNETPFLPTTESLLSNIPRVSQPRMETSGMEQLGAAMNPRGPVELAKGAGRLAGGTGRLVGNAVNDAMVYDRGLLAGITPQPNRMFVPATLDEAKNASRMLKTTKPEDVWRETGVGKYGGEYVKEISDKEATAGFTHLLDVNGGERIRERAFEHPELYSLMPELKNFGQLGLREDRLAGNFAKTGDVGSLTGYAPTEQGLKTVMAHEMQHGVQDLSGWERGGSIKDIGLDIAENKLKAGEVKSKLERLQNVASDEARRANPELITQAKKWADETGGPWYEGADDNMIVKDYLLSQDPVYKSLYQTHADLAYNKPALLGPEETYSRLAGEAQARSTQNRVELTPEERLQYYPFEFKSEQNPYGLDVKPEDLLFRENGGLLGR